MRDPIEKYLEDVLVSANLARGDERTVRAELSEHLQSLFAGRLSSNPKEAYAMIQDEFGKPGKVGRGIAAAKGRMRTYFKKQLHHLPIKLAAALVLAFAVRWSVAQTFYAAGPGAEPAIPQGSRVLVYKLARTFEPRDVIVFRVSDGTFRLGIVKQQNGDTLLVSKHNEPERTVPMSDVVGRVILNTR